MKKALIAMSGGVDSSLAAKLMLENGYSCIGCTMKLFQNEDAGVERSKTCCSLDDVEDARSVAYRLGIPYYVFNFTEEFRQKVIRKFADSYENGITPNPCIDCNTYLKFQKLYQRAVLLGCDCIVTGHYARIEKENGSFVLKKALDESKDQSYVLYHLTQKQLAHTVFPLGDLKKSEVRAMAERSGFCNAQKPDSQDICFVPNGDYASVVQRISGRQPVPGDFTDKNGHILGRHRGILHYTIGQRRGLGISAPEPLYVCDISPESNTVVLGENSDLFRSDAIVRAFHWISGKTPQNAIRCKAKIRYRQPEQWATAVPTEDGAVQLRFDEPQRAITPGQAAVLYQGDTVLGGGVIARR
ncbi:MAG: tRNA 2-thiouridine(34) synthase MnmA [Oscillospiraceae bacterium]|nr:tRNA 2-thiouridine(34) synthase MnmA [Oscillospiraceae bacterium]